LAAKLVSDTASNLGLALSIPLQHWTSGWGTCDPDMKKTTQLFSLTPPKKTLKTTPIMVLHIQSGILIHGWHAFVTRLKTWSRSSKLAHLIILATEGNVFCAADVV